VSAADWEQLLSVALVGTERKPPSSDGVARVAALVDLPVAQPSDESTVLTAAGIVASYRRAGLRPVRGEAAVPAAAPDDPRPEASPAATQLLELLLEGHIKVPGGPGAFAAEWLTRCTSAGRRAPARLLPALLDHGTRSRDLRAPVVAAGGPRLAWLARHNPKWSWAAASDDGGGGIDGASDDEVWLTGDHAARMTRLVGLRATDPTRATDLVEESWAGEKARDRVEILDVLRTGLGPRDEPFLDQALDDRAPTVRTAAADLLASLPTSALAARMTDRLRPLVAVTGRGRRKRLEVALPDEPDDAARRDGIRDEGAPPGIGRRTWWLIQLVGATPLRFWTDELGLTPADAVRQVADAKDHPEILDGWALAARRQRDGLWARELIRLRPEPALLRALPPEDAWAAAAAALSGLSDGAVPGVLSATAGPWSPQLTAAAVARLRTNSNSIAVEQGLSVVAAAGDASAVPALEQWLGSLGSQHRLRHQLRAVVHALSIRQTIAQEFA
jgi:hypothetical protein